MNDTKQDRLETVNKIIKKIASCSRGFFYDISKDRYAKMIIKNHKVFFVDDWTGEEVYAYNTVQNNKMEFSHGGTLWGLVNDFREFIVTGEYTNGNNGYSGLYCNHWGYDEADMLEIQAYAKELGYLKKEVTE